MWQTAAGAVSGVGGATAALLRVSRACGAAPVALDRRGAGYTARVSRRYTFIGYIITLLLGVLILASLVLDAAHDTADYTGPTSYTSHITIKIINFMLMSVAVVLAVFRGPDRMRRFLSYCTRIQQIHVSIDHKPTPRSLEKVLTGMLAGSLAIVLVVWIANTVLSTYVSVLFGKDVTQQVVGKMMYVAHMIASLLILQITFAVTSAFWTLKSLNKSVISLEDHIKRDANNPDGSSTVIDTIRRFAATYTSIFDICSEINDEEGFIMVLLLLDSTFRILAFAFFTISASSTPDFTGWMYAEIFGQLLHCIRVGFHVVILVEACHRTHGELKRTQVLISQLLCVPTSAAGGVSESLCRFYEITVPCGDVYTPMGTFKFSRSLYTALIGGLVTLTIILVNM